MDLQKTFDTADHQIFQDKMKSCWTYILITLSFASTCHFTTIFCPEQIIWGSKGSADRTKPSKESNSLQTRSASYILGKNKCAVIVLRSPFQSLVSQSYR